MRLGQPSWLDFDALEPGASRNGLFMTRYAKASVLFANTQLTQPFSSPLHGCRSKPPPRH